MKYNTTMKKLFAISLMAILALGTANAQHHCGNHGHCGAGACQQAQTNANGMDMIIVSAFPTVKSIKKEGQWVSVLDVNNKLLGYVVYSKPASDGIKGYAGETPVMIAFDTKKVIKGVYLLQNSETPRFVQHVKEQGFFNQWNGLSVKKALKKNVDTVSGATFTSRAVVQSVEAVLKSLK